MLKTKGKVIKFVLIVSALVQVAVIPKSLATESVLSASEYAMFDLYRGARTLTNIDENVDPYELLIFGIFLSNYLEPFATEDGVKGYSIFLSGNAKEDYLYTGQPDYETTNEQLITDIISKAENNTALRLGDLNGNAVTFEQLYESPDTLVYVWDVNDPDNKYIIFDNENYFCNTAMLMALAKGSAFLSGNYETIKQEVISLDGFGNIVFKSDNDQLNGTIIIPACLNPYIFDPSGEKLVFVNDYYMSNYDRKIGHEESMVTYTSYYDLDDDPSIYVSDSLLKAGYQVEGSVLPGEDRVLLTNNMLRDIYFGRKSIDKSKFSGVVQLKGVAPLPLEVLSTDASNKPCFVALVDTFAEDKLYIAESNTGMGTGNNYIDSISITDQRSMGKEWDKVVNDINDLMNNVDSRNEYKLVVGFYDFCKGFADSSSGFFGDLFGFENNFKKASLHRNAWANDIGGGIIEDYLIDGWDNYFTVAKDDILSEMAFFNFQQGSAESIDMLNVNTDSLNFAKTAYKELTDIHDYDGTFLEIKFFLTTILNRYTYKCLSLTQPDLIKALTSKNSGMTKSLDDTLVVHMFYTYLKYYAPSGEWSGAIQGYNDEVFTLLITIGDYQNIAAQLKAQKAVNESNLSEENMRKSLLERITGLLDPNDGTYRVSMLKSTATKFISDLHYSITQSSKSANASGVVTGSQIGLNSFLTSPNLEELFIFNNFIKNYAVYFIIGSLIITIIFIVVGLIGLGEIRKLLLLYFVSLILLIIPPYAVNLTVDTTNKLSEYIFTDKFNLFAISQHQEYLTNMSTTPDPEGSLVVDNLQAIRQVKGDEGVFLKWNSPKKIDQFKDLYKMDFGGDRIINVNIFKWIASGMLNQEFYPTDDSNYVYRSYYSISRDAKASYDNATIKSNTFTKYKAYNDYVYNSIEHNLENEFTYVPLIRTGSHVPVYAPNFSNGSEYLRHLDGSLLTNVTNKNDSIFTLDDLISNVKLEDTSLNSNKILSGNTGINSIVDIDNLVVSDVRNPNELFLLQTESLYYYFYAVLRDYYTSSNTQLEGNEEVSKGFSNDLFYDNLFKVTDINSIAYGEIKDFLDIENLFTNVIPQLRIMNNIAIHGINLVDNTFNLDPSLDTIAGLREEMELPFWSIFTPWVSAMYRTEYWKNNDIGVSGENIIVPDGFNPKCYSEYRPMLFSPAQKVALRYSSMPVSLVESKIHKVLENTYKDCLYAINNVVFADEVLLSNIALRATFHFNREFSQAYVFKEDAVLYPQSFNIKGFSYNTFMKMFLSTSSGEPLVGTQDFYERIIGNSSILSGLALIIVDIIGVWVLPILKLLFIILLIVGLYIALVKVIFSFEQPINEIFYTIYKCFILPIILYIISSGILALCMSLMIGSSYNNIIGEQNTLMILSTVGSLFILVIVFIIYGFVLVKIVSQFAKDVFKLFKTTMGLAVGLGKWVVEKSVHTVGVAVGGRKMRDYMWRKEQYKADKATSAYYQSAKQKLQKESEDKIEYSTEKQENTTNKDIERDYGIPQPKGIEIEPGNTTSESDQSGVLSDDIEEFVNSNRE